MLFYIWKSFYIRKSHCWQGNYFSKSQKQIQGREKELRKVETRTHDRTPQGQTMRTNQAVRHRQWAGPDTGGACPLSAHDEPSRDPIAFLRTISLPVYQILNSSFSMLRVEKLLHSIYRTSIDQLRGRRRGQQQWTHLDRLDVQHVKGRVNAHGSGELESYRCSECGRLVQNHLNPLGRASGEGPCADAFLARL